MEEEGAVGRRGRREKEGREDHLGAMNKTHVCKMNG